MKSVSAEDHPDFPSVKWSRLELDWIRERDREWEEQLAECEASNKAVEAALKDVDYKGVYADGVLKLKDELETERMRLAGCGVAAMMNTRSSVKARIGRDNPYWSASYGDVCRAVDAEIELREEVARLNEEIEFLQKERSGVIEQSNMHPSWLSKSKEEILDCLRFQGATTAVLLVETKELREEVARLMSSMHRENGKAMDNSSARWLTISRREKAMLLTEQEIREAYEKHSNEFLFEDTINFARAIEAKVIEKIKAQGGVVRRITTQDSMTGEITMNEEILYRLPEGE